MGVNLPGSPQKDGTMARALDEIERDIRTLSSKERARLK